MNTRGAARAAYVCQAECVELTSGTRIPGARISDLSESGAFVESMVVFGLGSQVRLDFALGHAPVSVIAEVVNPMPAMGMGLRFLDLGPESRSLIQELVGQAPE
jgi:hypothetical protein